MSTETLHGVLKFWATRSPDRIALKCLDESLSWAELDTRSDALANGLIEAGIGKGDRVGILMRNRIEFIETLFAIFKVGAAATLLNVRFTASEMCYPIKDAALKLTVSDDELLPLLDRARQESVDMKVFSISGNTNTPALATLRKDSSPLSDQNIDSTDIALICYTSGTTGASKGAMISHGNIWASGLARIIPSGMNFDDCVLVSLPLAYTGGLANYLREGLITGATTIIDPSFNAEVLMSLIEKERVTTWSAVPVILESIMNHPRFAQTDFTSLRHLVAAGASVSQHLLETWQGIGVNIMQGYGLTEASGGFVTILYGDQALQKRGFAGRPVMHTAVRIVDEETGEPVEVGQPGEILVKGPTVMKGYLNKPAETDNSFYGQWLRTGDVGFLDEEGFLKIVDRSKDMLISGGLNVYPAELETVLAGITGLEEFAIIGVADAKWGEIPMIVCNSSNPVDLATLGQLIASCLADYKRPRYLVSHGEPLPRTFSGKILKRKLREQYPTVPTNAVDLKAASMTRTG